MAAYQRRDFSGISPAQADSSASEPSSFHPGDLGCIPPPDTAAFQFVGMDGGADPGGARSRTGARPTERLAGASSCGSGAGDSLVQSSGMDRKPPDRSGERASL